MLRSSPVSKTWFYFFSLYKQIWLLSYIIRFLGSKFKWLHYFMVNISVLMIVKQSPLMKTPCFITFPCSTILRPPTNHSNVKKLKTMLSYGWKLNIMDKSYTAVTSMGFYFYWLAFFRKSFGQNSLEDVHFVAKDYINTKFSQILT